MGHNVSCNTREMCGTYQGWGNYNSCSISLPLRPKSFFFFSQSTCTSYLNKLLTSSCPHSSCFRHGFCSSSTSCPVSYIACPILLNFSCVQQTHNPLQLAEPNVLYSYPGMLLTWDSEHPEVLNQWVCDGLLQIFGG